MEKIIKCMTLPKAARDELGIGDDGLMPDLVKTPVTKQDQEEEEDEDPVQAAENAKRRFTQKMQYALYGQGKYFLIPSFFRTLMYLKKNKKEFALTFRTYGKELDEVV